MPGKQLARVQRERLPKPPHSWEWKQVVVASAFDHWKRRSDVTEAVLVHPYWGPLKWHPQDGQYLRLPKDNPLLGKVGDASTRYLDYPRATTYDESDLSGEPSGAAVNSGVAASARKWWKKTVTEQEITLDAVARRNYGTWQAVHDKVSEEKKWQDLVEASENYPDPWWNKE
eukprot:gnl/TRDRNA2_/TRDRNA2_194577_c0_seq1.p1 gnl/TRDRNA2_/TRDRNA2_194577_c0~~gnl/TRDRNA2_/TRDRNA2_194577_c0_seq1.p1  ORF type:complete len:200 (+),score=26.34 gnl/TRDRNA2_/TRDRNA2_194577_c0_seq1:87-602(+)